MYSPRQTKPQDHFHELTPDRYEDRFICPVCGFQRTVLRFRSTAGKLVQTYCHGCNKQVKVMAGPITGSE